MDMILKEVLAHFSICDRIIDFYEMSGGSVNNTYHIKTQHENYVMQKMNSFVFGNGISNIAKNYSAFVEVYQNSPDSKCGIPLWKKTVSGDYFYQSGVGDWWRVYPYLNGVSLDELPQEKSVFLFAQSVAKMHRLLKYYKGKPKCAINHYHDIDYYIQYYSHLESNVQQRDEDCESILNNYLGFIQKNCKIHPSSVIHGDTKITNFIYDKREDTVSYLDLDTFCYSSIVIDIADSVRSIANPAGDIPQEASNVDYDKKICIDFLRYYIEQQPGLLTSEDKKRIPFIILRMPFELGLRFYCDYLSGNQYFPVEGGEQNLMRAKCQLSLFLMMLEKDTLSIYEDIKNC